MPTCFVIQPFDGGAFDKRFRDVFSPAIKAAGFEPYRVDQDHGVIVPVESIESGIRDAQICLADITRDNPNVWYELGFAFASRKQVVMVCSEERAGGRFPFDIQHRAIVLYKTESQSDFEALANTLTQKILALSQREQQLGEIAETELVAPVAGLSPPELTLLAVIATATLSPESTIALWSAKNDADKGGLTGMGFNLALRRLLTKGFVATSDAYDEQVHEHYPVLMITDSGWDWMDTNESKFNIVKGVPKPGFGV